MSAGTWDDVLTAALLGTDRRTLDPADLPEELGALGARLPGTDAPGRLLGAAVLLTTVRRAGAGAGAPGTAPPPPAPAAPETARVVGVAARERLAGLLTRADGEGAAMLAEWLRLAAERSLVAPPALLPPLLDLATRRPDVAGDVRAVLGERGRWLAAFRADWRRVVAPGAAPETEPATRSGVEERVGRLTHGTPDEAALEDGLADRSLEVRAAALAVAARLPDSAFTASVANRALESVTLERRALRRTLVVRLPTDPSPLRSPDPFPRTQPGIGVAAWHVHQLVAATPLDVWERTFRLSPEELLVLPVADDYRPGLHQSWRLATERQQSPTWARALLGADNLWVQESLLRLVSPEVRAELFTRWARAASTPDRLDVVLGLTLREMPGPWPTRLRDGVLAVVAGPRPPGDRAAATARARLPSLLVPDEGTQEAVLSAAVRREDSPAWQSALLHVADHLFHRRQMHEELR